MPTLAGVTDMRVLMRAKSDDNRHMSRRGVLCA